MITRCPSCGSQVKDDERACGSCGWDFVAQKRILQSDKKPPASAPSVPPSGGFSLPPARNLNEPPLQSGDLGSKPPSKIEPSPAAGAPAEGAPFALPSARGKIPQAPAAKVVLPEVAPAIEPELKSPPALSLPAQADEADIVPEPAAKAAPELEAKAAEASSSRRGSPVYIAAVAGAAIGTVSVLAVYLLLRQEPPTVQHPAGGSPFVARPAPDGAEPTAPVAPTAVPAPAVVPSSSVSASISTSSPAAPVASAPAPLAPAAAPKDESRPAATFASSPHVVMTAPVPTAPKPAAKKPSASKRTPSPSSAADETSEEDSPREGQGKPKGPTWAFEGVIFDLLTARGVFAAKLSFQDEDGNVVGEASTGGGGNYKVVLPAGGSKGYSLKITHGDYTERYIDEGDATSSLREATPEERRILMQAGVRNLPWVGVPKKTVRRDLGLVPKTPEEP